MKKHFIIIICGVIILGSILLFSYAQAGTIQEFKKRVASQEIAEIRLDWMVSRDGERKTIFESKDKIDFSALKLAVEDILPKDTGIMASLTNVGLASSGVIYIKYREGKSDQIDVGCGFGYFVNGSRRVSDAFYSWGLTKFLMRVIDQSKDRAQVNRWAGCFVGLAGDNLIDPIDLQLSVKKDTLIKGEDIQVHLAFVNKGEIPYYLYRRCDIDEKTLSFEIKDQWGRPRFSFLGGQNKGISKPIESDFVKLQPGQSFECKVAIPGKEGMSSEARYYGRYTLEATYENIASYEDYCSGVIAGECVTVHFARSKPIEIHIVRDWGEFQERFDRFQKIQYNVANRETVANYLGVPDNTIPNFKDERGQPFSDEYMEFQEWVYVQPFPDKNGKRSKVIITFKDNQVTGVRGVLLE